MTRRSTPRRGYNLPQLPCAQRTRQRCTVSQITIQTSRCEGDPRQRNKRARNDPCPAALCDCAPVGLPNGGCPDNHDQITISCPSQKAAPDKLRQSGPSPKDPPLRAELSAGQVPALYELGMPNRNSRGSPSPRLAPKCEPLSA